MKRLTKIVRQLLLMLFIVFAAFAMGLSGNFIHTRERYLNKETQTEQVDKKEEEEDDELKT
jgi:hypothetical protein